MPVAASAGWPAVSAVDSPSGVGDAAGTPSPPASVSSGRTTPRPGRRRRRRRRTRRPGGSCRSRPAPTSVTSRWSSSSSAMPARSRSRPTKLVSAGRRLVGGRARRRRLPGHGRRSRGQRRATGPGRGSPPPAGAARRPAPSPSSSASTWRASRNARSASAWRPGAVQGEHQLAAEPLAERRRARSPRRARGPDSASRPSASRASKRSSMAAARSSSSRARRRHRRRDVAELGERLAAPQARAPRRSSRSRLGACPRRARPRPSRDEPFEAMGVDVLVGDDEDVAGRRVSIRSAPRARRSLNTTICSALAGCCGAASPHSSSISRSAGRDLAGLSASSASSVRCRPPGTATSCPLSSRTSSGPRRRTSTDRP